MTPDMWLKIGITLFSLVSLYLFRRKIMKVVMDFLVGEDTERYHNLSLNEILKESETRIDEVLR